ncbi:MAG: threonine--tRNA ligase [archaeon]
MEKAPFVTEADKKAFWHSTSHILADAVKKLWPEVKLGIGPAIDEGFYYDFDKKEPFTADDLTKITREMHKIIGANQKFEDVLMVRKEAERFLKDEPYKLDLLKGIPDAKVSFHRHGTFTDLCNSPMIQSTGQIGAFKLLTISAAYWRGDSDKSVLQRIYGISFPTEAELDEFVKRQENAEKNNHLVLGKKLGLFSIFPDIIGSGLPIFLPKGATVRRVLERFIEDEEIKRGYQRVYTPDFAKEALYETSGHLPYYADSMYPAMKIDEDKFRLKPTTCPLHCMVFKSAPRSYRELPLRIAELAKQYRLEKSGALMGLQRVAHFVLADSHIFCTEKQAKQEVKGALDLVIFCAKTLGFKNWWARLSMRDKDNAKYVKNEKLWETSTKLLRECLEEMKVKYVAEEGHAAFYGPKIDIQMKNIYGKEDTLLTVQVDYLLPERFKLEYIGEDNKVHTPVMVHRSSIGCIERTIAFLIENYAGAFPVWLAPVQVKLLTFTDRNQKYAEQIEAQLKEAGLRIETDYTNNTVEYKVRNAEIEKIPYVIVIGDKEETAQTLAVRKRGTHKVQFGIKLDTFLYQIKDEIEKKI